MVDISGSTYASDICPVYFLLTVYGGTVALLAMLVARVLTPPAISTIISLLHHHRPHAAAMPLLYLNLLSHGVLGRIQFAFVVATRSAYLAPLPVAQGRHAGRGHAAPVCRATFAHYTAAHLHTHDATPCNTCAHLAATARALYALLLPSRVKILTATMQPPTHHRTCHAGNSYPRTLPPPTHTATPPPCRWRPPPPHFPALLPQWRWYLELPFHGRHTRVPHLYYRRPFITLDCAHRTVWDMGSFGDMPATICCTSTLPAHPLCLPACLSCCMTFPSFPAPTTHYLWVCVVHTLNSCLVYIPLCIFGLPAHMPPPPPHHCTPTPAWTNRTFLHHLLAVDGPVWLPRARIHSAG